MAEPVSLRFSSSPRLLHAQRLERALNVISVQPSRENLETLQTSRVRAIQMPDDS